MEAALPKNEASRLAKLERMRILDTPTEARFDQFVHLVGTVCEKPMALLSFVDDSRQWIKASYGSDLKQTPREHAFCAHVVADEGVLIVEDALKDERFSQNPYVVGPPYIRFYAGVPLATAEGCVGSLCVLSASPDVLTEEQLEILSLAGAIVVELLERREYEHALKSRVELFSHAEHLANLGHCYHSLAGGGSFASERALHILGADEAVPDLDTLPALFVEDDRDLIAAAFAQAIESRECVNTSARLAQPDGSLRFLQVSVSPESGGTERPIDGLFTILFDVTERTRLLSRSDTLQKMATIGTLFAGLAHEMSNPITYIDVNAQVLRQLLTRDHGVLKSEVIEALEFIEDGIERVKGVVEDIRRYSYDTPRRVREVEGVDVGKAVALAARLSKFEVGRRAILKCNIPSGMPHARIDEGHLAQVLINLILNASAAFPEGSPSGNTISITSRFDERAGIILIAVRDNGPGIPPEVLPNIFTPFFTSKKQGDGLGLGLVVCKELIEAYGGKLSVDTEVGEGTTFLIELEPSS